MLAAVLSTAPGVFSNRNAQLLGRKGGYARAVSLTAAERTESARRAAFSRWQRDVEMSGKPLITFEQWTQLGPAGIDEILRYIKQSVPGKSGLSLSLAQYRALTGRMKCMFLHKKGRIKRPTMSRDAFERLSPGKQMGFMRDGGVVDDEKKE
jgi:hypothetical protein